MTSPDPGYWVAVSRDGQTYYLSGASNGADEAVTAVNRIVMSQKDADSIADILTESEGVPWYAELAS